MEIDPVESRTYPSPLEAASGGRRAGVSLLTLAAFVLGVVVGCAGCWIAFQRFLQTYPNLYEATRIAQCTGHTVQISKALDAYRLTNGRYPMSQQELVPEYLAEFPQCPAAGRMTYRTSWLPPDASSEGGYVVECAGHYHKNEGYAPNVPAFSSRDGLILETNWSRW